MGRKPQIFVSYSRHDEAWRERVETHLRVLDHKLDVWSDERIALGDTWRDQIRAALENASAAVLLLSADFLASPFIRSEEVPVLLDRRRRDGVRVVPVIVKACAWNRVPWLAAMQIHPRDSRPLAGRDEAAQDESLAELAHILADLVRSDRGSFVAAQAAVDAYRDGLQTKLAHLEALHPTKLRGSDGDFTSDRLLDRLSAERLLVVTGPSGSGKSHALRHAARDAVRRGLIPLLVEVRDLNADFGRLLDRSVESLHPGTCGDVLGVTERTGTGVVLFVDVMNPLRSGQLGALVDEVGAFVLRNPMPALLTTRESGALSVASPHARVTVEDITDDDRQAIFALHGGHRRPPSWEPFPTAYAATLLARCSAHLGPDATFHLLLHAYARQQLERADAGSAAFSFLRKTALDLSERLLWTIPSAEFRRRAESYAEARHDAAGLGEAILRSQLLREERGECAFAHERLQHFFEAEALLAEHSGAALVAELVRPRHADAVPFVIEALTTPADVGAALQALGQAPLIADCLRGRHGKPAQMAVTQEARSLLRRLEDELPAQVVAAFAAAGPIFSSLPTASDRAFAEAVGRVLPEGILFDELAEVLATVDASWDETSRTHRTDAAEPAQIFWALHVSGWCAFEVLRVATTAIEPYHRSLPPALAAARLEQLVAKRGPFSLHVAAGLIHACRTTAAHLLPTLVQHAWATGIPWVRLRALEAASAILGSTTASTRVELARCLNDWRKENDDLACQELMELLYRLGMVDLVDNSDTIRTQIDKLLCAPDDAQAHAEAYHLIGMQIEGFQPDYTEAIASLDSHRYELLCAMAAMGALQDEFNAYTMMTLPTIAGSSLPLAVKALQAHTRTPKPSPYFHDNVWTFAFAFAALGLRDGEPPRPKQPLSTEEGVWQVFGEMQFWMTKLRDSPEELRARCAPLWESILRECSHAAVHLLWYIEQAARNDAVFGDEPARAVGIRSIVSAFPIEAAELLMHAVAHVDKLTSIFGESRWHERGELATFAIATLGRIGPLDAIALIEPFADHPELGRAAVTAIRSIRERSGAPDGRP